MKHKSMAGKVRRKSFPTRFNFSSKPTTLWTDEQWALHEAFHRSKALDQERLKEKTLRPIEIRSFEC
jgi:hypothetical protein